MTVAAPPPTSASKAPPPLLEGLPESFDDAGPGWLAARRADAASALRDRGLPGKKDEAWRFTSVRPVTTPAYAPAPAGGEDRAHALVRDRLGDDDGADRLVVLHGRPLEGARLPEGVSARPLAAVLTDDPGALEPVLGRLAPARHFAALNAARFDDGLLLEIGPRVLLERPLHVVHVSLSADAPVVSYPRTLLRVGEGVQANVVETFLHDGAGAHLANAVTEVFVGPNARLDHTRASEGTAVGHRVETLAVRVERDARYVSRSMVVGGAFHRLDLRPELAAAGAEVDLDGVYLARDDELVDHHVRVEHAAPHTTSRVVYRGILDGRGHGVFDAIARVQHDAHGAEAHQENRNLLLSDHAELHTKPHLEIETDDVKASHGATVGSLDEDQVFYLRSRGIDRTAAEAVLTYAFVESLVDRIPHQATRRRLAAAVLARLPRGEAIADVLESGVGVEVDL